MRKPQITKLLDFFSPDLGVITIVANRAQSNDFRNLELKAQNGVLGRLDVALRGNVLPVLHELVLLVAGLEAELDDYNSC